VLLHIPVGRYLGREEARRGREKRWGWRDVVVVMLMVVVVVVVVVVVLLCRCLYGLFLGKQHRQEQFRRAVQQSTYLREGWIGESLEMAVAVVARAVVVVVVVIVMVMAVVVVVAMMAMLAAIDPRVIRGIVQRRAKDKQRRK
jgi:flagellar basal body-associated protein FliL